MDQQLFETDTYAREAASEVIETGEEDGRPWARLAATLFYPEGGGQPADRGRIGEAEVIDVVRREGRVLHVLDRPVVPGPTTLTLDWDRRFDHMQQHTGQHLLTAVCNRHGAGATVGFHLGEIESTIDLDAKTLTVGRLTELEDAVNAVIREARPVRARIVAREDLAGLPVRSRGMPEDVGTSVRLVEIEGVDLNTCGGTHVRTTAELQMCRLLGTEGIRGQVRLRFLFGGRVLHRIRAGDAVEAALKERLGAGPADFAELIDGRDRERRELARAVRRAEADLARALSGGLVAGPGDLIVHHQPGRDMSFLGILAAQILEAAPDRAVALFGDDGSAAYLLVATGPASIRDAQQLGARAIAALEGRGGGKGNRFQGRGPDAQRIPGAVRSLRE